MMGRRTAREKFILGFAGTLILAYGFVELVGQPLYRKQKTQETNIESKILFINKYNQYLSQKSYYKEKERASRKLSEQLSRQFLSPPQPALAAAGLQKSLEEKARSSNVQLVQVKPEKSQPRNMLLGIPVQVTVKSTLEQLSHFIQSIETDRTFLVVEELVVRRLNNKEPEQLESSLTILGFIQPLETEKPRQT